MTCGEVRELLPALSLDAVEVDERDLAEDHIANCPTCADELGAYQEVAAELASTMPSRDPPAQLRRRLLAAAIAAEPPRDSIFPGWIGAQRRRVRLTPAALVAAVALVVAIGTSIWAYQLQAELNGQTEAVASLRERANRYDRVVAVLQSPELRVMALEGTAAAPGAIGRVYVDPDTGAGMMMVRSLPKLPKDRVYQLWWVRADGTRQSGGLLSRLDGYGNGYTLITCPESLKNWQAIGVTEEPAGGSPGPTGERLLGGTI